MTHVYIESQARGANVVKSKGNISVKKEGKFWNVINHFENGGSPWSTYPNQKSAREAARILRTKGYDYNQGGKEAMRVHDQAWDDVEPRLGRAHAKHAREFLAGIPKMQVKALKPQLTVMKNAIRAVEAEAKLGPKNAEQVRRAQAKLFDIQDKIQEHLKKHEKK